jgi:hypothetical protein
VSVITFPRRVETRSPARTRAKRSHQRAPLASRLLVLRGRSVGVKLAVVAIAALAVVMAGNSYAAQRQVAIHQQQSELLQYQAKYASQIAALSNMAAPARVAAQAGRLHLEVPTSVTQIGAVSLAHRLPTVRLRGYYVVQSRIYK